MATLDQFASLSPIQRTVWSNQFPTPAFEIAPAEFSDQARFVVEQSLLFIKDQKAKGKLYDANAQTSAEVVRQLGESGYWGLPIAREFTGSGVSLRGFTAFLTRMATVSPTVAGLAAVHSCIGAAQHLQAFGSETQQAQWLPRLVRGELLAIFALTEPGAGSDLSAIRTRAVREGDWFAITGEKLFITNAAPGRLATLICLVDDQPAAIVAELPAEDNDSFQWVDYGLHALRHTANRGFRMQNFRVLANQLLLPATGGGLAIAYHGLNRGRVALCANAAGSMRILLAGMVPWANFRHTYGAAIGSRELVRRRLARAASLIVGADALAAWCSTLLDAGQRCEMECIVAKVFGSEALKETAIELAMKTHGGRAFLHGHAWGDHLPDYLAPCIYEGEGELLSLAFFRSLIKPCLNSLASPAETTNGFGVAESPSRASTDWLDMPTLFKQHTEFAAGALRQTADEISTLLQHRKHTLPQHQCRLTEISQRVQQLSTIVCVSRYAASFADETERFAADLLCQDISNRLLGRRPSDEYFQLCDRLGATIAGSDYPPIAGIATDGIQRPY